MSTAALGLAFAAGALSTLSPCVLPLLPIVVGTAASEHRLAPVALAGGVALALTAIGLFVATLGFSIGLDATLFRTIAAVLLIGIGVVLTAPALQVKIAVAAAPVGNWADSQFRGFSTSGIRGQFGVGMLLGAVWSPCAGPTLGAASLLAGQGQNLGSVAMTMALFGSGAALPLLLLGALSREASMKLRSRFLSAGQGLRLAMGAVIIFVGIGIISGYDKTIEAMLLGASPPWLTRLTTSI